MSDLFGVFTDVIVPIIVVAGLGGWLAERAKMPVAALSELTFYLFSPALVFTYMADLEISGEAATRIVASFTAAWVATAGLAMVYAIARRHDRSTRSAIALTSALNNGGNMGLPIAFLAFGEAGLEVAVLAFVASAVLAYTVGIMLASLAGGAGLTSAATAPLKVPTIWAALAALAVNAADVEIATSIDATLDTLGGASIPVMLVVLGMQMRQPVQAGSARADVISSATLRLVIAPLLAWAATEALHVDGVAQRTIVVVYAMPTAVVATILATQYNARPAFVTRAVIWSTAASVVTLTVLVAWVR